MSQATTGLPFDDIRALIGTMPGPQTAAASAARGRNLQLVKPAGSLGRLEDIAVWLASWQADGVPSITRPLVAIFAASHGVAEQGVSAYPAEVTGQMLETFAAGGGAINQICIVHDLGLKIFDLAIDRPTPDITRSEAMSEADCAATIAFGMEAIAGGTDLLVLGEMGIGNTTIAAAICHGLYGGAAEDWTGYGTGVDDAGYARKVEAVRNAVSLHGAHLKDPLEILRRLGGRELMAIAGAILAARHQRIPVLLDGYVVCAAAAILHALDPSSLDHCLAAHRSAEAPHGRLLEKIGKSPLLDLGMKLGEASGAALAVGLVRAAAHCHTGMATFTQAGVSQQSEAATAS